MLRQVHEQAVSRAARAAAAPEERTHLLAGRGTRTPPYRLTPDTRAPARPLVCATYCTAALLRTLRHKESDLNVGENSCVDRCVAKYWQVVSTVGALLGNNSQQQAGGGQ